MQNVMFMARTLITIILLVIGTLPVGIQAYFGISVQQPLPECLSISSSEDTLCDNNNDDNWKSKSTVPSKRRELVDLLKLSPRQKQFCWRDPSIANVLMEALRLSAIECQHQMYFERWNCSLDSTRINILNKETAFLYAISSAGLLHTVSRACSTGHLTQCTCDESFNDVENRRTWMWGGCGDNLGFGLRFVRRFLHQKKRTNLDLRALMDHHNSRVGTKVVRDLVHKVCKCHGLSGSCTMQTCWKQLSTFGAVGQQLKLRYNRALEARTSNDANVNVDPTLRNRRSGWRQSRQRRNRNINKRRPNLHNSTGRPTFKKKKRMKSNRRHWTLTDLGAKPKQLVYLEHSPDFCNSGRPLSQSQHHHHWWGSTRGRVCIRGQNCEDMCCGRGYNVQIRNRLAPCNCKVHWCCRVQCDTCVSDEEILTCK